MEPVQQGGERMDLRVDKLLTLPTELILYIVSFLPFARDRVKLCYVSRKLRSVIETPSLWREFEWPYYDDREERCLNNLLKTCGKYIQRLTAPDHVIPSRLIEMLQYCSAVTCLSLSVGTKFTPEQLRRAVEHMKQLQMLNVLWEGEDIKPLLLTGANLKKLTVYVSGNKAPLDQWMHQWVKSKFIPRNVNFVTEVFPHFMIEQVKKWFRRNSRCPAGHSAVVKFYKSLKVPLDVFPPVPMFQLDFGPTATLPFIRTNNVAEDLEENLVLVTKTTGNNKPVACKAIVMANSLFSGKATYSQFHCNISDLKFVTYFDAVYCRKFYSSHLEQVATAFPNLQQLSLQGSDSLKSLQGLRCIAHNCEKLQGLNLLNVSVNTVENRLQLWKILSEMKLTCLMMDLCMIKPPTGDDNYEQTLAPFFQKFVWLKVLTVAADTYYCKSCQNLTNEKFSMLSYFPVLTYCKIIELSYHDLIVKHVTNCEKLEYLYISLRGPSVLSLAPSCKLRQLCVFSKSMVVTDRFMEAVSAHGGLEHVVFVVNSMTIDGIATLVKNSPILITCRIIVLQTMNDEQSEAEIPNLEVLNSTLKKRYSTRKLFTTAGSYQIEHVDKPGLLQGTEFDSMLWTIWHHYSPSYWCGTC